MSRKSSTPMKVFVRFLVLVGVIGLLALVFVSLSLNALVKGGIETMGPRILGVPVTLEDVDVTLRAGVLSVAGERSVEAGDGQVHRQERLHGKFTRSFRLPTDADDEAINASARDGVITIAVGKRSKAKPRAIEVRAA